MSDPATTGGLSIRSFTLGDWQTNCYVVSDASRGDGGACWIIDPGFDPADVIAWIRREKLQPTHVMLTHAHLDHIAGVSDIRDQWPDIAIVIHPIERAFLTDPTLNLSAAIGIHLIAPEATDTFRHGEVLTIGAQRFEVRHTPGHSPGSVTFYNAAARTAIVGDVLFAGSVGRTDFPTSSPADLMTSIRQQLLTMPDDTVVLPGHGPSTMIGRERRTNPFLRG
jgi:glyoxylase-like metal-dependent hydrolase (beta-lactamase superfamily II)